MFVITVKILYLHCAIILTLVKHMVATQDEGEILLKKEIQKIADETVGLEQVNANLKKTIGEEEVLCLKGIKRVTHEFTVLLGKFEIDNEMLKTYLKNIEKEELIHVKLRNKLAIMYSEMKVVGQTLKNSYEKLKILRGSVPQCDISPRFLRQLSKKARDEILLKENLEMTKLLRDKEKSSQILLLEAKENIKSSCLQQQSNIKQLISDTKNVLEFATNKKELLKTHIKTAQTFTESMKTEIDYGDRLLKTLKVRIEEIKKKMEKIEKAGCYENLP